MPAPKPRSFSDLNGNGQVTETEIIQVEHYYPFAMAMEGHGNIILSESDYKYNGKELNADFGLDLYDYPEFSGQDTTMQQQVDGTE